MHAPTLIGTPGLLRYVQNHVAGPPPIESEAAQGRTLFDGYSCGWWEDEDAFQASGATAQWLAPAEDAESMFDMPWLEGMSAHVEAHTIIEGPSSPYKVVWILRFRKGINRTEAFTYWRNAHGPLFKSLDIDRYVQNHAVEPIGRRGTRDSFRFDGFDGFSECWFKDEAHYRRAVESPTWTEAVADGDKLFDRTQRWGWGAVLHERVIKPGRGAFAEE